MTRVKKNFIVFLFLSILFLTAGIFVGCGEKTEITSLGHGQVERKVDKDNNELYTAIPDKWNEFLGWFEGDKLYSSDPMLAVPSGHHKKLQARFGTNGEISVNRAMEGIAKTVEGKEQDKYLNISFDLLTTVTENDELKNYTLSVDASLSISGDEHVVTVSLKDEQGYEKMSLNLHIGVESSKLYFSLDGDQFAYDVPCKFENIKPITSSFTIQQLAGENYQAIASVLGYDNQLGLFESVENTENKTKLTIRVDKILDYLKNIVLPNLAESDVWMKEFIETFTKKYQGFGKELPVIKAFLEIDYQNDVFQSFAGKISFEEDYKLELEETYLIKAGTTEIKMISFDVGYSQSAQEKQDVSSFPAEINVANMQLEGKINFLQKNIVTYDYTILDSYNFNLNSDVNIFAFAKAMKDNTINWDKIDWENFGYLSLSMALDDSVKSNNHNGQTNYLSVLIDTEKFGPNLMIYAGLYNSHMSPVTAEYVLNNTFYLPKVMSAYGDSVTDAFPEEKQVDTDVIINALKGMIGMVLASETLNTNEVIFKFIEGIMSENVEGLEILKDCFVFEEGDNSEKGKIVLAVDAVDHIIKEGVSNISSWLGYASFTDNLFGQYTSHVSFDFENIIYGKVDQFVKDQDIASYNQAHKTIVSVSEQQHIAAIDDATLTEQNLGESLDALVGQELEVEVVLSDGEKVTNFVDYLGQEVATKLTVHSYKIVSQDEGQAKVEIYFTYAQGTLAKVLYTHDIPYGLVALEKTILFG